MLQNVSKRYSSLLCPLHVACRAVPHHCRCRNYATSDSSTGLNHWPTSHNPTPYEILNQRKSDRYSKHRYVELVKVYHPDLAAHDHHSHDYHIRLERFRLVVAAHTILSDERKRRAYDLWGVGWVGGGTASPPSYSTQLWQKREGYWSYSQGGKDDISQNATWEDWERWRRDCSDPPSASGLDRQRQVFTKNIVFATIVIVLAGLGSIFEAKYAFVIGNDVVDSASRRTKELDSDMKMRRGLVSDHYGSGSDRENRVRKFLIARDPVEGKRYLNWSSVTAEGSQKLSKSPSVPTSKSHNEEEAET
jgi:curved DNA-binding protein CbpA